jgi:acetyl esterase
VPLDPQIRMLFGETIPDLPVSSAEDMRRFYKARELPGQKVGQVASVLDRYIPSPGGELGIRVYTPFGTSPLPLMLYFHAGGWVAGNLDSHDPIARNLCAGVAAIVVAVDYRLAPENRFPAATDDCMCALDWLVQHAEELKGDATRIAVAGDSAGGNLAAVTALRVRDEGGPRLAGQLLIYPATAHYTRGTRSYSENGKGYLLTREAIEFFWTSYLDGPASARNPYTAPLEATDLSRLSPAMVITAEFDPLRDEGEEYGERLRQAGVPTVISRYDGMIHGFFGLTGIVDKADAALDEACIWLRRVLTISR